MNILIKCNSVLPGVRVLTDLQTWRWQVRTQRCRQGEQETQERPTSKNNWAGRCDTADCRSSFSSLRKKVWTWLHVKGQLSLSPAAHFCPKNEHFSFTAQERMNELEAKVENMLATVDRVFKVELMKMPPSLQNTLIMDLISGELSSLKIVLFRYWLFSEFTHPSSYFLYQEEEIPASEVSIAMKVSWVSYLNL